MDIRFSVHKEIIKPGDACLVIKDFPIPLTQETRSFSIAIPEDADQWITYTATTGMRECIGNMIDDKNARGYLPGDPEHPFRVRNPFGLKKGARCYITEHLKLNGKSEYIVTQHRIHQGQLNFVNFGYVANGHHIVVLIVDVITGETQWA